MFKPKSTSQIGSAVGNDGKSLIKKYDLFEIQWINFIITTIQIYSYCQYLYIYDVNLPLIGKLSLSNPFCILLIGELIRWAVNRHILQINVLPLDKAGLQMMVNNNNNKTKKDHNQLGRNKIDYPAMIYEQFRKMFICLISIMVYSCICVIMGAPGGIFQQFDETISLAITLTILTVLPYLCVLTTTGTLQYIFCDQFEVIKRMERYYVGFIRQNAMWTLIGAWVASVVIPLDWDRHWQKYPIPNVVGAIIGYSSSFAFTFGSTCFAYALRFFKKQFHH